MEHYFVFDIAVIRARIAQQLLPPLATTKGELK
jgi:hypothetical protein